MLYTPWGLTWPWDGLHDATHEIWKFRKFQKSGHFRILILYVNVFVTASRMHESEYKYVCM